MHYITRPTSRKEIRILAKAFRNICGYNATEPIDPVELLDRLPNIKGLEDVFYTVVGDNELAENVPAQCDLTNEGYQIKIKESVYVGACERRVGGSRMHIMHEIAHAFADKIGFHPIFARTFYDSEMRPYESLEWIVKALAGEVMIPHKCTGNMSVSEIMEIYGVSQQAAEYRKNH